MNKLKIFSREIRKALNLILRIVQKNILKQVYLLEDVHL